MSFPMLDTPRTDMGDQTRLSAADALDFTTENSVPSPTKESNDLLRQIRGMRAPNKAIMTTPRARQPLLDRRNVPSKPEFTPLLKSATRNRGAALGSSFGKENGQLRTPAGLKASYHGRDSPALPLSSSIIEEQYTESFLANDSHGTPMMPAGSSSVMSTPMSVLPGRGGGPLDHGNMATLREQEARLEQIDKENFSLKLRIHFMEEALKRNGKEFNEAAIKENTELKVDNVTLKRDLKHYRRLLAQAEKDLDAYKRQLLEYAENLKRNHTDGAVLAELDELRCRLSDREEQVRKLEHELDQAEDEGYNKCNDENRTALNELRDTIADLEADIRDKDRQLDERQEELDNIKDSRVAHESQEEIDELKAMLQESKDDIKGLHDALNQAGLEHDAKLREKDSVIEQKDDELRDLEDRLKSNGLDRSFAIRTKDQEVELKDQQLKEAQKQLGLASGKVREVNELKDQIEHAKDSLATEARQHARAIEDKNFEIRTLEQKLDSSGDRDSEIEKLQDQIADLEADLRERQRSIDQHDDEVDALKSKLQQLENETDDELIAAQDRIQELEIEHGRAIKELGSLREASNSPSQGRAEHDLTEARARIQELEEDAAFSREEEQKLQKEIDLLRGSLQRLEQSRKDCDEEFASEKQTWLLQRQSLDFAKSAAEKQAEDLREKTSQLQQIEGSLSGKETQLRKMLESEQQRHESNEGRLRDEVARTIEERDAQQRNTSDLHKELHQIRQELQERCEQEGVLQRKVIDLEEEVEVLQSEADDDAARSENKLQILQQDLGRVRAEHDDAKAELSALRTACQARDSPHSPSTTRSHRDLQQRVTELELQLDTVKDERNELQYRIGDAETARDYTKADLDTLQLDLQTTSGSRSHWQQQLRDAQSQMTQMKMNKRVLEETMATSSAELNALQKVYGDLEDSHSTLQRQLRELQTQSSQLQREGDRKLQSQVAAYEHDIQNLEQDLADAEVKHASLLKKQETSESMASRQRSRMVSLEAEIAALRNTTGRATTTSSGERRDLHDMLKDAKLEAEDLALQLKECEVRISNASTKESELRSQLRRVREDRAAIASRADADMAELEMLRNQVLQLETATLELRKASRTSKPLVTATSDAVDKRHAAELKGLARQIEYLSARCRREEAFRSDLGFVKQYFQKTVEMYGRCNALDLKLVKSMGIATSQVLRDEKAKENLEGPGRVALAGFGLGRKRQGVVAVAERSRPTFKVLGLMVLAGVRMQKHAEKWAVVRGRHEELLKKLRVMKKGKDGSGQVAQSLGKRKTLK